MFVATCMAGMVTMATLNNRPEVIKIHTTTTDRIPTNSTTLISTHATTTITTSTTATTTTPHDLAVLYLCTFDYRN